MSATIKIPAQFTAVDKFSHVVKGMTRNVRTFSSRGIGYIRRFDNKISKSFSQLSNLSKMAIGLSIGALFANSFEEIKQFETGLVGVGKTTGITGSHLKKFGQDTIGVSNSLRGITTKKLLELSGVAGQLGISDSKNILMFSETLAKLEKASDIQGEEGATSIARMLKITGEGPDIVDRFSSTLVGLGNNIEATESQILSVASEVARSTSAYKLNSKEILGISAAMTSMGVAPEAAGTAIFKTFLGIEKATLSGGKQLTRYAQIMGISANETKKLFAQDNQAAFLKLIGGLSKIKTEGGSVNKALTDLGLSNTTIVKGITPLIKNYDDLVNSVSLANREFESNTALNNEFNTASRTMETALKDISKAFNNVLTKASVTGSGLEKVQNAMFFVADNMETIIAVSAGFAGIVGAMKLFVLITNVATLAQTLFAGATLAATWPILAIIAAIAAVIAIFYYWDNITAWFSKQWQKFTDWIGGLWERLTKWFKEFDFKAFFRDIGMSILKFMLTPMKTMLTLLSKLPGKVGSFAKFGLDKIADITGESEGKTSSGKVDSPMINQAKSTVITKESIERRSVDINIKDKGNNVESIDSQGPGPIPIQIGRTQGAF